MKHIKEFDEYNESIKDDIEEVVKKVKKGAKKAKSYINPPILIEYKVIKKEEEPKNNNYAFLMTMAMSMGISGRMKTQNTPSINVVKEYGLIQLKKSNLSKRNRDWVVRRFESNYRKIKTNK